MLIVNARRTRSGIFVCKMLKLQVVMLRKQEKIGYNAESTSQNGVRIQESCLPIRRIIARYRTMGCAGRLDLNVVRWEARAEAL